MNYTPGNFYSDLAGKQIIKELIMIAGDNVTTQTPNRTSPVANSQYSTRTVIKRGGCAPATSAAFLKETDAERATLCCFVGDGSGCGATVAGDGSGSAVGTGRFGCDG